MRRNYASTEVGQIHYRELGEGDTIVMLHHTASSSITFHRVMPLLADWFRVIAMDTPGFGASEPPPEIPGGMDYYARALVGLLDDLEIERAHLVGLRTGASIALEAAASHPERVSSMVLSGTLFLQTDEDKRYWRDEFSVPKKWEADGRGEFLDEHVLEWVNYFAPEDDGEQYLLELIAALQAGPRYWWAYRSVVAHDAYGLLPQVQAPLLFANVQNDAQFELTRRAYEATAGSQYTEVPGPEAEQNGWVGFATRYPQEYADAIAGFIAGVGIHDSQ